jgi:hypothetical protein
MAWRLARSLVVLRREVRTLHPGTTVWDIGDEAHRATASDHNPNAADVVCAIDVLPNAGLDLRRFADRVVASDHPALKYVIYNRRIWSVRQAAEGWRPYTGSNPHTGHVHVSVGIGPDGRSTGPYDDQSPWGLLEEDDMPIDNNDVRRIWNTDGLVEAPGSALRETPGNRHWAPASFLRSIRDAVRPAVTSGWKAFWPTEGPNTSVGTASTRAAVYARRAAEDVAILRGEVAGLTVLLQQALASDTTPLTPEQFAQLLDAVRQAAREPAERLAAGDGQD